MLASGSSGTAPALPRGALAPPAAAPPATTATTTTTKDRMMGDDTAAAVESRTAANATAIDRLARAAADPVSGVACRVMSDGHHDYPGSVRRRHGRMVSIFLLVCIPHIHQQWGQSQREETRQRWAEKTKRDGVPGKDRLCCGGRRQQIMHVLQSVLDLQNCG